MGERSKYVIGVDLGDKYSQLFVKRRDTGEAEQRRITTTPDAMDRTFGSFPPARVALEVGTHSPWVSRMIQKRGHEVIVANPRMLGLIHSSSKKTDQADAEKLALLADYDPELLRPVTHRTVEAQAEVAVIRARDVLVRNRTVLVNHVRGAVKSCGGRLRKCSATSFARSAADNLPEVLRDALGGVVEEIASLTAKIREYDKKIEALHKKHPETQRVRQVTGVGAITALAFVLLLGNPMRFRKSRDVPAYLGLVTRRSQTGASDPELRITKTGDRLLRRLLVQSAHYILGNFGPECDLKDWGLALAARGRKNAKKRAVVAVARKLSVLLHRLWVTGGTYDPRRTATAQAKARGRAAARTAAKVDAAARPASGG